MAVRAQPSSSSLNTYAAARSPGVDLYNGSTSRDFCNAFWGVGDAGVNILFARMRGAARTTDDLRNFWRQRSIIEEEYSNQLQELAKMVIGKDEIGELRNAVDTLKLETEKIATAHAALASQIRQEMEDPITLLLNKQIEHRRNIQAPLEKRFKTKQTQEGYVVKAREKYQGDCIRINSYNQQIEVNQGRDIERIQRKLQMAQQTVQANERDYAAFVKDVAEMAPAWEGEWKEFCDTCQDLEEERVEFMKDNLWTYANAVSTVCVTDDLSCEAIRTVLDQLEPERDVENFVQEYGTGNTVPDPPEFVPYNGQSEPPASASHTAHYTRKTRRHHHPHHNQVPASADVAAAPVPISDTQASGNKRNNASTTNVNGRANEPQHHSPPANNSVSTNAQQQPRQNPNPPPSSQTRPGLTRGMSRRESVPLPVQPSSQPFVANPPSPPPPPEQTGHILFYVKALYDYRATIEEEFDFQAGDVIAVTATPDDGWWSGELLDEARREEGRHIFPSNFVCLF